MSDQSPRVFLCHSSSDKASVRRLYERLIADGVSPWLDEVDLLPGQDWELEIAKAIKSSAVVLVCLSATSVSKTGFVNKEIKFALDRADAQPEGSIYLIPIRLEACEVPYRLKAWQWVDLFESTGYQKLLAALALAGGGVVPQERDIYVSGEFRYDLAKDDSPSYGTKVRLKKGVDLIWHEALLIITIVNKGGRPQQLVSIFVDKGVAALSICPPDFPYTLAPGTRVQITLQPEYLMGSTIAIRVNDAVGNSYSVERTSTEQLTLEANSLPLRKQKFRHERTGEIEEFMYLHARDSVTLIPSAPQTGEA